jgi:hypothetical protein
LGPLLQPADVGDALRSVCAIDDVTRGPSLRMNLLEQLAEPLAALPPTTLGPLLSVALADLWALTRGQFLNELSALVPAIAAFGGAVALEEAARAIRDVGRWLP